MAIEDVTVQQGANDTIPNAGLVTAIFREDSPEMSKCESSQAG